RTLAAPSRALADAIAEEWNAQGDVIDPGAMPLTRLANSIIDAVADAPGPVAEEIANYLATDLLCYRADAPAGLCEKQAQHWDPVLAWARDKLGARFVLAQGVVHVAQPAEAVAAARVALPGDAKTANDIWRLGALSSITTLTGSALLALALMRGDLDADAAWDAAHVDEDWQMAQWGRDEQALERRSYRRAEFDAAVSVLKEVH
ncbi:MAG: ATP12 family protein, partial [Pseudolabrys sp.]